MVTSILRNMMLVALVAAAPGVAAFADAPLDPLNPLDALDNLTDTAAGAPITETLEQALACQQAVNVPVGLVWGDIVERKQFSTNLLEVREVQQVVDLLKVPILETTLEPVRTGLLSVLEPGTREVTRIVGYDVIETIETRDLTLDIRVDWQQQRWDFDGVQFPVQLALPAGAAFLATGIGELTTVCDGSVIHAALPDFPNEGHDEWRVCIGCMSSDPDRLDGWYTTIVGSRAIPVSDSALATRGESDCPLDVLGAAGLAADAFALSVADGERDIPVSPDATTTVAETPEAEASSAEVAATASSLGAIMAAAVGLIGLVTARRW